MAITKRHLIAFITGLLACSSLLGQSPVILPIELNFTAYAVKAPSQTVSFIPRSGAASVELKFYTSAKSDAHRYIGPNPVTFFHETASPDPASPPFRQVVARVSVPEGITNPLFIFFPNPELGTATGALPYLVYTFNDSESSLPAGHVALINASGMEFLGQFNQEILPVPQGLNQPVNVGRSARIELRTLVRGRYYQSYLSTHPFSANERALILLLPPIHPGSIEAQVRILRSEVEQKPKP